MHNITLRMRTWREVRNFASQKFRLTPESLFNFGSSRSLPSHFLSENMGKFPVGSVVSRVWTGGGFSNLKKFLDPDSTILEQERSRSLKKLLRPPVPDSRQQKW